MYDHSDKNGYALKGFFNGTYFSLTKAQRKQMALSQLEKYYGKIAHDFLVYEEKVWRDDPYVFKSYESHILPHQNNGHPIFKDQLMGGKLILSGSETASSFPGYMDGAVESGWRAINNYKL
jgi:monoamine oxidase